jgi:thymidine phosphorylase
VRVVAEQGGNPRALEDYSLLPQPQFADYVVAPESGYIAGLEARAMGVASMILGAGRERSDATIDPAVGLVFEKKVGDAVRAGERVCVIYSNDRTRAARALDMVRAGVGIAPEPIFPPPLVLERILHSEGAATPNERNVEF